MISKKLTLLFLSVTLLFTSCNSDDDNTAEASGDYVDGLLISHEGNFGQGNASISFVSYDFTTVENNIFEAVNSSPLGDTAQSITFNGDFAYIVMNVSNSIQVVNRYTFESIATIDTGLNNPRYMAISNGKGYVTNWADFSVTDDDFVAVIDLSLNLVTTSISSSYLPEEIIALGDKVYVATGIYGYGNLIDVINSATDELEESIVVGNSPNSLQLDSNSNLWVLSSENLIEIDTDTNDIAQTISLGDGISFPSNLIYDNSSFYFYDSGSVYKMDESADIVPTTSEFSNVSFYDMNVRNGILYGVDAGDFTSNGVLKVYDLNTNTETQSITLNIIPGGVYFN
tara:strand:- start:3008 stop:4033 length:1026 start_codon:yes stop_codon:yes gene_type:complete